MDRLRRCVPCRRKFGFNLIFRCQEYRGWRWRSTYIRAGTEAAVDFSDALGAAPSEKRVAVRSVKFVHPFFHLALLDVDAPPQGAAVLKLASQMPAQLASREVMVLAFFAGVEAAQTYMGADPSLDELGGKVYDNQWGRLFLHPGYARQMAQLPGSVGVPALLNDCST
jgi:hypothetical protein